jgi:hypothetical protein
MSKFTNALLVSPLSDGESWVIVSDFSYDVGTEGSNDRVNVKTGFVTDFASVPRMLWWALPKWGTYGNAAVIHDWLYWDQSRTRKEADAIMLEAMDVLNVSGIKKNLIYRAVRIFGEWAWNRNKWDKESGFNRIIEDTNFSSAVNINRPSIIKRTLEHRNAKK